MANRHKSTKAPVAYAGGNSNVVKEAEEKKFGGPVKKKHKVEDAGKGKMRLDKMKRGGRAMGGRCGADKMPLSSASKVSMSPSSK